MNKFKKYPKIRRLSIGKRDAVLHFNSLILSHKIDGSNARICYSPDEERFEFGSRNTLLDEANDNYGFFEWASKNIKRDRFREHFNGVDQVVVFGEWFGKSIQKRIDYPEEKGFRVFDVFCHSKFVDWFDVIDICQKIDLAPVQHIQYSPDVSRGKDVVYDCLKEIAESGIGMDGDPYAVGDRDIPEGIVVRPPIEAVIPRAEGYGERLISKVKSEEFEEVRARSNKKGKSSEFSDEEIQKVDKYITQSRVHSVVSKMSSGEEDLLSIEKTSDVIRAVIQDIKEEAEEKLNQRALGKRGGKIAAIFHELIERGGNSK